MTAKNYFLTALKLLTIVLVSIVPLYAEEKVGTVSAELEIDDNFKIVVGDRLDINWEFIHENQKKVSAPFLSFVEVIKVSEPYMADDKGKILLYLMMTEKQSKFLEIAKTKNDVSQSKISVVKSSFSTPPSDIDQNPMIIGEIKDNWPVSNIEDRSCEGTMNKVDPKTGGTESYCLKDGIWKIESKTIGK